MVYLLLCLSTLICLLFFSPPVLLSGDLKTISLISKDMMEDIKDVELPERGGLTNIKIVALRGEYEPFTFSVYSERENENVSVTLSSLKKINEGLHKKGPPNIEIHKLIRGKTIYNVKDWILMPLKDENIRAGESIRIWGTVHIPEAVVPGLYRGSIEITSGKALLVSLPITVKVINQKLEASLDTQFAVLYTVSPFGQYYRPEKHSQLEPKVLDFYRELRAHGMTSVSPKCSDWPYRKGNIDGLKAEVTLATKAGLKGPVLWYMSALINGAKGGKKYAHYDGKCDNWNESRDLTNLKDIVRHTKETEEKEGWPEVIFITVDEPGTDTEDRYINDLRMEILEKSLKVVSEMGGLGATTVTELVDDRHNKAPFSRTPNELRTFWDRVRPYCHIRIYGYEYPQGDTNLYHEKDDAGQRGHEVWFYNNKATMGNNRYLARTYFGLWGWKVGAHGLTAWTYPGARTVQWEIVREGIDDLKYLKLIESLIQRKGVPVEMKNEAKSFLNNVSKSIQLDKNGFVRTWRTGMETATFRERALYVIEKLSNDKLVQQ